MTNKVIGVILASGSGTRFGSSIPKQFMSLNGKMVIQYVIDNMKASGIFDDIYVVSDPNFEPYYNKLKDVKTIIFTSHPRVDNMSIAMNKLPKDTDFIIFQDSVRPFTTPQHFQKLYHLAQDTSFDFLITTQCITDALFQDDGLNLAPVNRKNFALAQCPEIIKYNSIKKLNIQYSTDAVSLAEWAFKSGLDGRSCLYEGNNLKITYDYDLFQAEQLLRFSTPKINKVPDIQGKKILLFGASGDIGTALKEYCEKLGATVKAPARNQIQDEIYSDNTYDSVINCIGAYCTDAEEDFYSILEANIQLPLVIIKEAEKKWLKFGGTIIMLGSTAGLAGRNGISLYGASKAFIHNYGEACAKRLLEKNIRINSIAPAKVIGKLQKNINPSADEKQMINPKDLARIIASYINTQETGKIIVIPVGMEGKHD